MQSRQFRHLTSTERKAKLIQALISKTEGRLKQSELESIANYRWQLGYRYQSGLAEDFDLIERQMTIVLHANAKTFAEAATLQKTGMTHSWAGDDTFEQYGNWIVGEGEFGNHVEVYHSNNGDVGSPEVEDSLPEFNLDRNNVIAVKSVTHDSLNRNSTIHEEDWKLHILLGGAEYSVEPAIAEIIKKFNLESPTSIYICEGTLNFNEGELATRNDYLAGDRCVGSVYEALAPGESIRLKEGVFQLDEDLDI